MNQLQQLSPLILSCNKLAVDQLRLGNLQQAHRLLTRAQELLSVPSSISNSSLLSITLNNLGCYYRKINQPQKALQYLLRNLQIHPNTPQEKANLAGTHLNISGIISQSSDHQAALFHAHAALKLLMETESGKRGTISTMILTLNRLAVQYEKLEKIDRAIQACRTALDMAQESLGKKHYLTCSLSNQLKGLMKKKGQMKKRAFPSLRVSYNSLDPSRRRVLKNQQKRRLSSIHRSRLDEKNALLESKVESLKRDIEDFAQYFSRQNPVRHSHQIRKPERGDDLERRTQDALDEVEKMLKEVKRQYGEQDV